MFLVSFNPTQIILTELGWRMQLCLQAWEKFSGTRHNPLCPAQLLLREHICPEPNYSDGWKGSQPNPEEWTLVGLPTEWILSTDKMLHASFPVINQYKTRGRTLGCSTASSHAMCSFAVFSSHLHFYCLFALRNIQQNFALKANWKQIEILMSLTENEKTAGKVKPGLARGASFSKK